MSETQQDEKILHRVVRRKADSEEDILIGYMIECPGCLLDAGPGSSTHHVIYTEEPNGKNARWTFNGDMQRPSFNPSVRASWTEGNPPVPKCCHFFIRKGMIEFCSDSTHALAGKTVPLPEW